MYDFTFERGRYFEIPGVAQDEDGNKFNLTSPAKLTFKLTCLDDNAHTLTKTTDNAAEIEKTDAVNGGYTVKILATDTDDFPTGKYRWEVVYVDNPSATVEKYTCNPKASECGVILLADTLT